MGKNLFISDLHFGHKNVLKYDNRPFTTIEEHDSALIENWNNVVDIDDTVYILGDISFYNSTQTIEILKQLIGNKVLIVGNHDNKLLRNPELREQFLNIVNYLEIEEQGKDLVLCHYPMPCFNDHYRGACHFYGHVHSSFEWNMMEHTKLEMEALYECSCNMFNVGAMMSYINYTPRTFEEIVVK